MCNLAPDTWHMTHDTDARHDAALKVQGAWSGGCKRPVEMGGGTHIAVSS